MKTTWLFMQLNYMALNAVKCRFLSVGFGEPFPDFFFNDSTIENDTEEKILGIVIDNNLNVKAHLKNLCKKANQKLSALSRLLKLTILTQREKMRLMSENISNLERVKLSKNKCEI